MLNVVWPTHATLLPATAAALNEWWLATLLISLIPAALILLWVIVAWFFLSDHPDPRLR